MTYLICMCGEVKNKRQERKEERDIKGEREEGEKKGESERQRQRQKPRKTATLGIEKRALIHSHPISKKGYVCVRERGWREREREIS